jgi:hypothetical protein
MVIGVRTVAVLATVLAVAGQCTDIGGQLRDDLVRLLVSLVTG